LRGRGTRKLVVVSDRLGLPDLDSNRRCRHTNLKSTTVMAALARDTIQGLERTPGADHLKNYKQPSCVSVCNRPGTDKGGGWQYVVSRIVLNFLAVINVVTLDGWEVRVGYHEHKIAVAP
jgi:hypothetical protein